MGSLPIFFNRSSGEWPRLPSTARIGRAQFHRARSASKEGTWLLLPHPSEAARCSSSFYQRYPADRVTADYLARPPLDHPAASYDLCQLSPPLQSEPHPAHQLARPPSDHPAASYEVCRPSPPVQPEPETHPADHLARLPSDHPAASYAVCQLSPPLQPKPG